MGLTRQRSTRRVVPIEAALGAHIEPAGALALTTAYLFAIRGRPWGTMAAFAAAVLIKPLPVVLAPLIWRSVRAACRMLEMIAWLWWTARRRLTPGDEGVVARRSPRPRPAGAAPPR